MCGSMELHFVTNKILTKFITGSLSRIWWWYNCNHKFHTFWSYRNWRFSDERFLSSFWQLLTLSEQLWEVLSFLIWKPANLLIMNFCVELCDGIICIHLFRTTFPYFSYNLLLDVVPRDNDNKVYLVWWLKIVDRLIMFWTLDIQESDAPACNRNNVLPWIDWQLAEV